MQVRQNGSPAVSRTYSDGVHRSGIAKAELRHQQQLVLPTSNTLDRVKLLRYGYVQPTFPRKFYYRHQNSMDQY